MILWTSSTQQFHFVAAVWFTHAVLSCASTFSLPLLWVWPFKVWSIHAFSIKKHAFTTGAGWLNSFTQSLNHWSPEHWDWKWELKHDKGLKLYDVLSSLKMGTRGYHMLPSHHKCPLCSASPLHSAFIAPAFRWAMAGRSTIEQWEESQHAKTLHSNEASLPLICHCFWWLGVVPWLSKVDGMIDYTDIKLQFVSRIW